jgi:hypothetical protein
MLQLTRTPTLKRMSDQISRNSTGNMKMLFPLLTSRNHNMTLHSLTTYVHLIYTNVIDNKSYRILELQFNTSS